MYLGNSGSTDLDDDFSHLERHHHGAFTVAIVSPQSAFDANATGRALEKWDNAFHDRRWVELPFGGALQWLHVRGTAGLSRLVTEVRRCGDRRGNCCATLR